MSESTCIEHEQYNCKRCSYLTKPCGNNNCSVSIGIHEGLTFGHGELDDLGYWEFPCYTCARAHEKEYPNNDEAWPFKRMKVWRLDSHA